MDLAMSALMQSVQLFCSFVTQEVIVLDTAVALSSTAEILEAHSIPSLVSKDMLALGLGLSLLPGVTPTEIEVATVA